MSDNEAVMRGYSEPMVLEAVDHSHTLYVLAQPYADLDGSFRVWDTDEQEWLCLNGWQYDVAARGEADVLAYINNA